MSAFGDFVKGVIDGPNNKDQMRRVDGFTGDGRVVVTDARGTTKAEFPTSEITKSIGDDPLAIYKPTGAKSVSAAKAMGSFTGWTFAAVNAIASEVSNIQWRLYQIKNGDNHEEQDDHDLLTLLEGVNAYMTGIELKYITVAHLELTGNCYWLLDGCKSDTDKPTAIHLLNPGRVQVKLNKTVFPYVIDHYDFTIEGKVYSFQPYQIVHFKYPDPNDPYVGIGIPQTIPTWIDSDNYAMEYNRKFFINGAAIGMFISTDTNVEGSIDRIRQGFNDRYTGNENAHKVPVLPKGVKLEHSGVTQKDMDFSKLTDNTRDRILAGFRVSKTILGTAESDTNRATAETADYVFSKRTIKPKMLLILSFLNEFLVPRYGDDVYLTFIDPVSEDKDARVREMTAASGGVPLMTQNETRKNYLGVGPVDGGDNLLAPSTMVPVGKTAQPVGEELVPQMAKVMTAHGQYAKAIRVRTGGKSAYSGTKKMRNDLTKAFMDALEKAPAYEFKSVKDMTHDEYGAYYKENFDSRTRKAEKELTDMFQQINAEQKVEVLKNLPEVTGQKALSDLLDEAKWLGITIDLATPILEGLTKDEAAAALILIGAPSTINILADAGIRAALDAGIAKMAKSYTSTTIEQLTSTIGDVMAQDGGFTVDQLTNAVNDVYAFADANRAPMIAQTESYRATNFANLNAWQQSGVVKTVVWYTMEDGAVCAECAPLDGKEVSTGADFFTASYGDGNQPPLHPRCRCGMRPQEISIE
jgi:HK97 family phage portal protein